jgi:hypothetical protein
VKSLCSVYGVLQQILKSHKKDRVHAKHVRVHRPTPSLAYHPRKNTGTMVRYAPGTMIPKMPKNVACAQYRYGNCMVDWPAQVFANWVVPSQAKCGTAMSTPI